MTDKGSKKRRGFCFVTFTSESCVDVCTEKTFHQIEQTQVSIIRNHLSLMQDKYPRQKGSFARHFPVDLMLIYFANKRKYYSRWYEPVLCCQGSYCYCPLRLGLESRVLFQAE